MIGPYHITLADLIDIADAAAEIDGLQFAFIDQPDDQARLRMRARKLHDMVERAAGEDYARVGGAVALAVPVPVPEIDRLREIEAAAKNLVAQKGRHHTEQAYHRLAALVAPNGQGEPGHDDRT